MAGRRIDDHNSWMGKGGKYLLPEGNKMKEYKSVEGVGKEEGYPDTSENIKRDQEASERQARKGQIKPGQRQ